MNNTNFVNPDGLDADNHYTSLNDLLILSKEVLKNIQLLTLKKLEKYLKQIEMVMDQMHGWFQVPKPIQGFHF